MKLSIIIPYYKTLNLTNNLINKLNRQKTKDIEIILIDDSQDGQIFKEKVDKYILNEENQGGAGCRNIGLDNSEGDYIAFIDSDDMVTDDYIQTILNILPQKNDLTWISWDSIYGESIAKSTNQINVAPWGCIYKKSIFENIRFNSNLNIGEEPEFWKEVFDSFPNLKIGYISKIIYHYLIREDSATRRFDRGELPKERFENNKKI